MGSKFKNKYRIPSARLQNWDYGSNGAYFITICTKNRACFFGEVVNGEMKLNEIGALAEQFWVAIPQHFPFVELGNFVVMPNHTHGILIIDKNANTNNGLNVETLHCNVYPNQTDNSNETNVETLQCNVYPNETNVETLQCNVYPNETDVETLQCNVYSNETNVETLQCNVYSNETNVETLQCNVSTHKTDKNEQMANISPKPGTISTIIRSYKSVVTKNARYIHADFEWQSRFHDHIIRDAKSFDVIQNYITNNPSNWAADTFN